MGFEALTAHNFREIPFVAFNRKDDMQSEFVGKAFGLKRVMLNQLFVPSSEVLDALSCALTRAAETALAG